MAGAYSLTIVRRGKRLGDGQFPIGPMLEHRLTGLETELLAVELHGNDIRLERHEVGDAVDAGIRLTIRPRRQARVTDVIVAAHAFVRAEALVFDERQRGLID